MKSRALITLLTILAAACFLIPSNSMASGFDLSKAIVIGNGPKKVIEFTDPDCPFCRRASFYLDSRKDITRYIFFNPLDSHPQAKRKVQYILSHADMVKAYHEAMAGFLDNAGMMRLPVTEKGIKLQEAQQGIARKAGYNSTPTFVISGRIIEGFEQPKIEELLEK